MEWAGACSNRAEVSDRSLHVGPGTGTCGKLMGLRSAKETGKLQGWAGASQGY